MLSRKRCRGTLQDYNKGEISKCQSKLWTNRNVFSWCLNGTRGDAQILCRINMLQFVTMQDIFVSYWIALSGNG